MTQLYECTPAVKILATPMYL